MSYKIKEEVYAYIKRRNEETDEDFAKRVEARIFNLKIAYSEPEVSFKKGDYDNETMKLEIIMCTKTTVIAYF